MEYDSLLDRHFSSCDSDSNSFLDSLEWLRCLRSPRRKEEQGREERDEELENRRYGNGTIIPNQKFEICFNFCFSLSKTSVPGCPDRGGRPRPGLEAGQGGVLQADGARVPAVQQM